MSRAEYIKKTVLDKPPEEPEPGGAAQKKEGEGLK